jgi:hypothetical protein
MIQLFRCYPLSVWITRDACAAQHQRFERGDPAPWDQYIDGSRMSGRIGCACVRCDVGARHRAGGTPERWPDGALIQIRILGQSSSSEERADSLGDSPPDTPDRSAPRGSEPTTLPFIGEPSPGGECESGAPPLPRKKWVAARLPRRSFA